MINRGRYMKRSDYLNRRQRNGHSQAVARTMPHRRRYSYIQSSFILRMILTLAAVIATALIIAGFFGGKADAGVSEGADFYKYYTSVMIEPGDTLTALALEYNEPRVKSDNEYIDEVCKINGIDEDKITSGKTLVLPYYSKEAKD